ncbi:hypothetical protein PFICI_01970 [Pestalotiopsis fici W106-1]|uniref:Acyl-CoA thioesterase II n=1 Tax=Pestalotiopsis fici (strain W106-1 / CGMCC3.15140) TaxID=1229662 RepID=W3XRK7_PESFW|nr:uncharacterized protein PFICI_01970 [Pestalotiopsis fici W106-1]ETS88142.1 hypothetical protein PFICI_01970 [Pestalotiopsis fici W106-1]
MPAPALIEGIVAVMQVPETGVPTFTNAKPLASHANARSVLGGLLIAQSVSAATATVANTFKPYSLQSSFLAPASPGKDIKYEVDKTADGRAYATRTVRAYQEAPQNCVFIAVVSFQNAARPSGNVLRYGTPKPDLDGEGPDDVDPSAMKMMQTSMLDKSVNINKLEAADFPFDWRPLRMDMSEDPSSFRLWGFVRAPPLSGDSHALHLAALAYASDEFAFGAALAANPMAVGKGMKNITLGTSLTHNVSFHDPQARVDEWIVIERDTTWGADGRVMVSQRMWDMKSGRLILSASQEALVRLRPKTPGKPKL